MSKSARRSRGEGAVRSVVATLTRRLVRLLRAAVVASVVVALYSQQVFAGTYDDFQRRTNYAYSYTQGKEWYTFLLTANLLTRNIIYNYGVIDRYGYVGGSDHGTLIRCSSYPYDCSGALVYRSNGYGLSVSIEMFGSGLKGATTARFDLYRINGNGSRTLIESRTSGGYVHDAQSLPCHGQRYCLEWHASFDIRNLPTGVYLIETTRLEWCTGSCKPPYAGWGPYAFIFYIISPGLSFQAAPTFGVQGETMEIGILTTGWPRTPTLRVVIDGAEQSLTVNSVGEVDLGQLGGNGNIEPFHQWVGVWNIPSTLPDGIYPLRVTAEYRDNSAITSAGYAVVCRTCGQQSGGSNGYVEQYFEYIVDPVYVAPRSPTVVGLRAYNGQQVGSVVSAKATVRGNAVVLTEQVQGTWSAVINAPDVEGVYEVVYEVVLRQGPGSQTTQLIGRQLMVVSSSAAGQMYCPPPEGMTMSERNGIGRTRLWQ